MAAVPPPLSPREASPRTSDAMAAQQASSIPALPRCASYPSRAPGPPYTPSMPSALLERRRFKMNPSLKFSSFQVSLGTHANRNLKTSAAFQAGVGTHADRSEGASAGVGPSSLNSKPATLYDVLEVPCTATENEIKTAYRRLAREHHPDRAPLEEKEASTTKFLQIHSAYAALLDPRSRAQYDFQLSFQSAGPSPKFTSSNYCSPRTPFSAGRGRSWETDQCWC